MKIGSNHYPIPPEVPESEEPFWQLELAKKKGFDLIAAPTRLVHADPEYVARFKDKMDETGVSVEFHGGMTDYVAIAQAKPGEQRELMASLRATWRVMERLGLSVCRTIANARIYHRFSEDMPLAQQLELTAAGFGLAAKEAEDRGIVLAWENHMDYTGREMLQVIEEVDSPSLRSGVDTGNGYTVFVDPLDDVEALAKYTVSSHLKDMKVMHVPQGVFRPPWMIVGAAVGEGSVDIPKVLRIFKEQAPDPDSLTLLIEISWARWDWNTMGPGPTGGPFGRGTPAMFDRSLAYLRSILP